MSFFPIFDPTNEFNILRLICGLFLLPHFYAKASDLELTYKIYDDYRLHPIKAWVYSCMAIEIVCAVGMVFAIYTCYVASLEAVFLFVAAWATWRYSKGKWLWQLGGFEYCLFWGICCVVVAMHGCADIDAGLVGALGCGRVAMPLTGAAMFPAASGGTSVTVTLPNEEGTARLAADVGVALDPGDIVTLSGDLGAGKTTFARALIRYLAGDETIEVPSPTFTLLQSYALPRFALAHADFYRLSGAAELAELGFDDLPAGTVVLMEWPDRAAGFLPPDRIDITFTVAPQLGPEVRNARLIGYGAFSTRVERITQVRDFLDQSGYRDVPRQRLVGDASTRVFERLALPGRAEVLMNSPRRPDGPPVRDGKPYSAIAHLAEDIVPYVALAQGLRDRNLSAPMIVHSDLERGFLVMEDLGDDRIIAGEPPAPIEERYEVAVDLLLSLHRRKLPERLPVAARKEYFLPPYDMDALLIEAELLLDWYLTSADVKVTDRLRGEFTRLWRDALQPAIEAPATWVLRDYHSPNLLWLPERDGVARIGLLDFQDAMMGPPAYDLASLLQDARVDVPEPLEVALLSRYVRGRLYDQRFDAAGFARLYATLAAQRATKILGIFARLDRRDGKPQYLRHTPRLLRYLNRSLAHPDLAPLKAWYAAHMPSRNLQVQTLEAQIPEPQSPVQAPQAQNPSNA